MVQSIISFEKCQRDRCNEHLKAVNACLQAALRVYYDQVVDSKIPRSIFVPYLQGFHGWAAGEMVDGKYTEYDGVSGAHMVLFNMLDSFLGLDTFLDPKAFPNYITSRQRGFISSVRKHAFREEAKRDRNVQLETQLDSIAARLRVCHVQKYWMKDANYSRVDLPVCS